MHIGVILMKCINSSMARGITHLKVCRIYKAEYLNIDDREERQGGQ